LILWTNGDKCDKIKLSKKIMRCHVKPIKKYKRGDDISYTLGSFPTYELIQSRPELVEQVLYDPSYDGGEKLIELCKKAGVLCKEDKKSLERIRDKENTFVAALFRKPKENKLTHKRHILLVNPSDMGNLGTILRTSAGVGETDVAMITPCADPYDPRAVRASMGACFRIPVAQFDSLEAYLACYSERKLYPFMLKGSITLAEAEKPQGSYSLVFGNEATGLPDEYASYGQSLRIPMSGLVDSYNLAISVAMGLYAFAFHQGK